MEVGPSQSGGLPRASHCAWYQRGTFLPLSGPRRNLPLEGMEETPHRVAVPLRSLSAFHAAKAGGRMDAEHLKTCARQAGFVAAPVNLIYLGGFWSANPFISKVLSSARLFF